MVFGGPCPLQRSPCPQVFLSFSILPRIACRLVLYPSPQEPALDRALPEAGAGLQEDRGGHRAGGRAEEGACPGAAGHKNPAPVRGRRSHRVLEREVEGVGRRAQGKARGFAGEGEGHAGRAGAGSCPITWT